MQLMHPCSLFTWPVQSLTRHPLLPCAGFEKPCKVRPEPDASCTVEIELLLRAFVPVLSAQSAAVAIRMLERLQQYEQYERFWRVRPQVTSSDGAQAAASVCMHAFYIL